MSSTSARNSPQVPQASGDTQYNVHNAALRGASSAFSKPPLRPKPQVNTYTGGSNGALLAASKVGSHPPSGNTSPLRKDWTGGSTSASRTTASSVLPTHALSHSSSSSTLAVPDEGLREQGPSPSNIAARLAAARYSPMKQSAQTPSVSTATENQNEHDDVLPPTGSVGKALARLDSTRPKPKPRKLRDAASSQQVLAPVRLQRNDSDPTDETPIPSTTSLVNMFEAKPSATSQPRALSPLAVRPQTPPVVRSPKPQRTFQIPLEPQEDILLHRAKTLTPPPVKPKPRLGTPSASKEVEADANFDPLRRASLGTSPNHNSTRTTTIKNPIERPTPPPKRGSRQTRPKSDDFSRPSIPASRTVSSALSNHDVPSSPSSFVSAREEQEVEKPKPSLPPPRRSTRAKNEAKTDSTSRSSEPLPPKPQLASKMPLLVPPSQRLTTPRRASVSGSSSPVGGTLYHNNYQRESVRAITKHMTGESLSSAIVGAALASSRNASPAPASTATPPLPIRTRQHHHHSLFHRSPSPPKPQPSGKLRPTMRREPSPSSDEDEGDKYRRKGTRIMGMSRKHPNKHHEGTRKRWRNQITERERKRYEGVWAANKGLYIPHAKTSPSASPSRYVDDDPSLEVLNLVTKEIWERSRLPQHALEEVWDLVDGRGVGRLRREEFVVGLWLVDQRLKGRKLPLRVSESVWTSVTGAGVKVKVGPRR